MGLVVTSIGQLDESLRAQALEAVRIRMNLVRSHAVAHRPSDTRELKAQPPPPRPRHPRQPAARRPSWYL
jgi:hypothetical protein